LCRRSPEYLKTHKYIAQKITALPVGLSGHNVEEEKYVFLSTIDTTENQLDYSKEVVPDVSTEKTR
jgi:hypothetical protein